MLDSLPPPAKAALMREFGELHARVKYLEKRVGKLEGTAEDSGQWEIAKLQKQIEQHRERDQWKRRAIVGAILAVLAPVLATILTLLVTGKS